MSAVTRRADGSVHATSAVVPQSALDATLESLLLIGEQWDMLHFRFACSSVSLRCERRGVYRAEWSSGCERPSIVVRARSAGDALCALKLELERSVGEDGS